jgi:LmbE family N-acetylglucosaminyl deacetylase
MADQGIAECFASEDKWFAGITLTDGAGSPRSGAYKECTDEAMQAIRRREQRKAAYIGNSSIQIQLAHPSAIVKNPDDPGIQADLAAILNNCQPHTVYLHQPADKHDTHIATLAHSLKALRALPAAQRPAKVYGCEVWRDLDWMLDTDKQALDTGAFPNIAASLVSVFDSQISGGKRYDLATAGRRLAHATYHTSHATDAHQGITWAMDLTPLIETPALSLAEFTLADVDRLRADIAARIQKYC